MSVESVEREQRVLGWLLMFGPPVSESILDELSEHDFLEPVHRMIFAALIDFRHDDVPERSMHLWFADRDLDFGIPVTTYISRLRSAVLRKEPPHTDVAELIAAREAAYA